MSFEWLHQRIQEEKDRRHREKMTLERLPQALEDLHAVLCDGLVSYREAFDGEKVEMVLLSGRIRLSSGPTAKVEVVMAGDVPGFRIERGDLKQTVEVGLLPSNKLYYRDLEHDVYLSLDDFTRKIMDRVLFPKLPE
jgi:hypothetical protein